jgi:hypothetical protein
MVRYQRRGDCNRCGDCCKPRFNVDEDASEWYRSNGLPENGQCQYLAFIDGEWTCTTYTGRSEHCRAFPWHPDNLKGLGKCSFWFEEISDDQ